MDLVVRAGAHGQIDRLVDGGGQYKAVVIVGVLADQVDAARRADDQGMRVGKEW